MQPETGTTLPSEAQAAPRKTRWPAAALAAAVLVLVLTLGAYFRFVGMDWDGDQHLHPDERFLTMAVTAIEPADAGSYFDTAASPFNPANRGFPNYVYGTLPLFLVRSVGELVQRTGYSDIHLVGRALAGLADLLVVLLVFFTALRLYRKVWLGVLAAGFSAGAVLQIQTSHYFTVDPFTNLFLTACAFLAVWILTGRQPEPKEAAAEEPAPVETGEANADHAESPATSAPVQSRLGAALRDTWIFVLFGLLAGMALSSKLSAAPVVLLLPAAALLRYERTAQDENQAAWGWALWLKLALAGLTALITFRVFQPYAFDGPGFFGLGVNEGWLAELRTVAAQLAGKMDFPPALQWVRRPVTFAWENMIRFGLGWPLGVLAWGSFVWMGWRIFKQRQMEHVLLWGWTAGYSLWQGLSFTRAMRYQLPVYPFLAILAAWGVFQLWQARPRRLSVRWTHLAAAALGLGVLAATWAWAFAFTRIYTRPVTRIAASEWIYENVPAAYTLEIEGDDGARKQLAGSRLGREVSPEQGLVLAYTLPRSGTALGLAFDHVVDPLGGGQVKTLRAQICADRDCQQMLSSGMLVDTFLAEGDPRGRAFTLPLMKAAALEKGQTIFLRLDVPEGGTALRLTGGWGLNCLIPLGVTTLPLPDFVEMVEGGQDYSMTFVAAADGLVRGATLAHALDWEGWPEEKTLRMSLLDLSSANGPVTTAEVRSTLAASRDARGDAVHFTFDPPLAIRAGQTFSMRLELAQGPGRIAVYGVRQIKEGDWDDGLPLALDGNSPFDYTQGLYRSELNLQLYWEDNSDKLNRMISMLDASDFIFSSSGRQWGSLVRIPERYPLTTAYFRALLGCPAERDIVWCYRVAQPGMFQSQLGFDLVYAAQSNPNLGPYQINTQFAEETFTVYDHPKVMVFQKRADYDPDAVRKLLSAVDLSAIKSVLPREVGQYKGDLILPPELLARQRAGGTWAELFNRESLLNRYPALGAVVWYLVVALLGWMMYPLTRAALGGLRDRGYPLARMVGLVTLAWVVWMAGSLGVAFSRASISLALGLLLVINLALFWGQRAAILQEIREQRKYVLMIEALALGAFLFFLLVRLGNPDLWHPGKGGEKPMDFSYFNAVLKSTIFPPYDPWFAGGYLNYYYYGYVIVGVLVKWLGIVPAVAYNLILPTLYSVLALGAFSLVWNLLRGQRWQTAGALAGAAGLQLLGNMGTVRMIWHGMMRLAAPGGTLDNSDLVQRIGWTVSGLFRLLNGQGLPYGPGDWYWIPSRVYPGEPITEFPMFTFLYADLHAHLIALPVTVLALAWGLGVIQGRWQWRRDGLPAAVTAGAALFVGGLTVGALWPTNTWDMPTYLVLAALAWVYTAVRYDGGSSARRWLLGLGGAGLLVALVVLFYQPYLRWNVQGYNAVDLWEGSRSPFWSYITHWALPLFILTFWLGWETREWMAQTPVSALQKLKKYEGWIYSLMAALFAAAALLTFVPKVQVAWLIILLGSWATVLLLRKDQPDEKRAALFMMGSGLMLTLMVEVFVLVGDIGRMNTVFKSYLQAWTLLNQAAAAALIWLMPAVMERWGVRLRSGFQTALGILVGAALLFPLLAGTDKIRDRMSREAPHTLDGMAYMDTSYYNDQDVEMELRQDADAIRWMQENIPGSPVIVEAHNPEYRWGTRMSIYTGLPGVVGWNWHQRQQRGVISDQWVTDRVDAVPRFYLTTERSETEEFLRKYDVRYIVVGQLEKAYYPGPGLVKFQQWDGDLWRKVFEVDDTAVYEVTLRP